MSSRKRFRSLVEPDDENHSSRSPRRIKVSHGINCGEHIPILVSSPGITIPDDVTFKAFQSTKPRSSQLHEQQTELLLHASNHPSLDYVAREGTSEEAEQFLKHYVGFYDPEKQHLHLVPTRKVVARSVVRPKAQDASLEMQASEKLPASQVSARKELGLAFGTKKAQKMINSLATNAIKGSPSKANASNDSTSPAKLDPSSEAVIYSMAEAASAMPTLEELQVATAQNRACPQPHLDAETPSQLYPDDELVGGEENLKKVFVKDWIDTIEEGGDVSLKSLFVARRLIRLVEEQGKGRVKRVRILRYLMLLIEWYKSLKQGAKQTLLVPKQEDLAELNKAYGTDIVNGVRDRFSKEGSLNSWSKHYLLTHILALALTIDNYRTDTHDICQDLRIDQRESKKLHRELGCSLRPLTEQERTVLGITAAEAAAHLQAHLMIPPDFPKAKRR